MTTNIPQQLLKSDHIEWDYCQIEVKLIDDGRGYYNNPGNKLMWFQFIGRVVESSETYIVAQSEKMPLINMYGTTLAPDPTDNGHQNALKILLETLQQGGWELLPQSGGDWWTRRLRRPIGETRPQHNELRTWLLLTGSILLAALILWLTITGLRMPFLSGVNPYISLPVTTSIGAPYRIGKVLPVNLDTHQIDPIHDQLPETIRAANANEVGTIVWIDCELNANWRNTHNNCALSIIDYAEQTKFVAQKFPGIEKGLPNDTNILKYRDETAMINYILSLPQK